MSETTPDFGELHLPDAEALVAAEGFDFNTPTDGNGGGISDFERDVQSLFDENSVTYRNDWAANTVGGYTFADYDHDGWYDHLERTDARGCFIYIGDGEWRAL